jgi:hypothetical protein
MTVVPENTENSMALVRSNWNLSVDSGGKPENPEKNPRGKGENQQPTQLT